MDLNSYFNVIYQKLRANGFQLSQGMMGYSKVIFATQQKPMAFGTRINFVITIGVANQVTLSSLQQYSSLAWQLATEKYPYKTIQQTGAASIALLVSQNVTNEAKTFLNTAHKTHFGSMELPIVFDMREDKLYYYRKTPIWGFLLYKEFRNIIETCLNPN